MKFKSLFAVATLSVAVALASCGGKTPKQEKPKSDSNKVDSPKVEAPKTIVEIASADPNFSTLVALLTEAGWVAPLSEAGKTFTVFAPTNAAFEKVDPKALEALKKDPKKLAEVLQYHVVAGTLGSGDLAGYEEVDAMSGHVIKIFRKDGKVSVGSDAKTAGVVTGEVVASNGVIHVIDAVIMPPTKKGTAKKPVIKPTDKIDEKPTEQPTDTKTDEPKNGRGNTDTKPADGRGNTGKDNDKPADGRGK